MRALLSVAAGWLVPAAGLVWLAAVGHAGRDEAVALWIFAGGW